MKRSMLNNMLLLSLVAFSGSAFSEGFWQDVKQGARELKQDVKEGARELKPELKEGARETGHAFRDMGKAIGSESKRVFNAVKDEVSGEE